MAGGKRKEKFFNLASFRITRVMGTGFKQSSFTFVALLSFSLLLFSPLVLANHADEGILNYIYGQDPDTNPAFQSAPGAVKSIAKFGYEANKFTADVVVGVGEGLWGTVTGLFDLGSGIVKGTGHVITHPVESFNVVKNAVKSAYNDPLGTGAAVAAGAVAFVGAVGTGLYNYFTEDAKNGHPGRSIGKGLFEVATFALAAGKLGAASKLAKAGEATKLAEGAEVAGEASKVAKITEATKATRTPSWARFGFDMGHPNAKIPIGPHLHLGPIDTAARIVGRELFGRVINSAKWGKAEVKILGIKTSISPTSGIGKAIKTFQNVFFSHPGNPSSISLAAKAVQSYGKSTTASAKSAVINTVSSVAKSVVQTVSNAFKSIASFFSSPSKSAAASSPSRSSSSSSSSSSRSSSSSSSSSSRSSSSSSSSGSRSSGSSGGGGRGGRR